MHKYIIVILILNLLVGCGGESSDTEVPKKDLIIGEWVTSFERDGASGESYLVISDTTFYLYEVGNGGIMNEWYSGLDVDTLYRFEIGGNGGEYILDGDEMVLFYSSDETSLATITEEESGEEIYSWEITNAEPGVEFRFGYQVSEYQLILSYYSEETVFIRAN
ncbi:hypothetical protein [Teredinibacter turnerae]|uniref:hypothetical protein n=1 Tax=Teredinibacter turnerae TaxID=2426 RepID=UPI000363516D|nr:hypothetical protein [Teredinibacter turnerae]